MVFAGFDALATHETAWVLGVSERAVRLMARDGHFAAAAGLDDAQTIASVDELVTDAEQTDRLLSLLAGDTAPRARTPWLIPGGAAAPALICA